MLQKLEEGSGTKFSVLVNGKEVEFKLAILEAESFFQSKSLGYGFVSENGLYSSSCYSGGTTGFGVSDLRPLDPNKKVITMDLTEMNRIAEAEINIENNKRKEEEQEMQRKVVRINQLPTSFESIPELKEFTFLRSEASYNPRNSRNIQGGRFELTNKSKKVTIWLEKYVATDGKLQAKKFESETRYYFATGENFQPKEALTALLERKKELNEMVKHI